jgi:2'-5' RNA ligase
VDDKAAVAGACTGRLFAALWPDPALRRTLHAWQAAWTWPARARPTPARDLHLTLVFIGPAPVARLPQIEAALATPTPAIELVLDEPALWHRRLAVLACGQVPALLAAWQRALADALRGLGLTIEARPYRPHVTLARGAVGATPPSAPPPALHWAPRGHVLAVRDGAHYRVLRRYGAA